MSAIHSQETSPRSPEHQTLAEKVDLYWQEQFHIPELQALLERRQHLLQVMTAQAHAQIIAPICKDLEATKTHILQSRVKLERVNMETEEVLGEMVRSEEISNQKLRTIEMETQDAIGRKFDFDTKWSILDEQFDTKLKALKGTVIELEKKKKSVQRETAALKSKSEDTSMTHFERLQKEETDLKQDLALTSKRGNRIRHFLQALEQHEKHLLALARPEDAETVTSIEDDMK